MDNFEVKAYLEPNTVKACHIWLKDGVQYVDEKEYVWHIPKSLRQENIKRGDVVLASAMGRFVKVVVMEVFRENIEDTDKHYKSLREKCGLSIDLDKAVRSRAARPTAKHGQKRRDKAPMMAADPFTQQTNP